MERDKRRNHESSLQNGGRQNVEENNFGYGEHVGSNRTMETGEVQK